MKLAQSIRRMLVVVCLVAPLSVPGLGSAATISGSSCQREGLSRKVNGNRFICKKGGKGQLRWRLQTATTVVNPPSDDLNQIVANGYVNLKGVRVSAITESDTDGSLLVEECGHLSHMTVTIWFKYANGDIREEPWVFGGKGTHIFFRDKYGNRVRRDVYVEAVGVDPYRFTEDWRRLPSDYMWCAILPD
jgi:hypothetical protein